MAVRRIGQLGWLDNAMMEVLAKRKGRQDTLGEISGQLDWSEFERYLPVVSAKTRGEASYPPLMMFKVLLLQRWYGLSDPGMEEALADRLSFRAFAGLSLEDETPDQVTIWRFRERLAKECRLDLLFAALADQLSARGLILRQGTLIDASLIQSAARKPTMQEGKVSEKDPEATFGANNERRRFTFGYKLHVAVDAGSGLVRDLRLTTASTQEISVAAELVQGDEAMVYADRGYDAASLHQYLADRGIGDGVMRRAQRNRPLTADQVERNKELSLRRRPVEAVFGTLKRTYGFSRMRYFSKARNHVALLLACFAFNLKRQHALSVP